MLKYSGITHIYSAECIVSCTKTRPVSLMFKRQLAMENCFKLNYLTYKRACTSSTIIKHIRCLKIFPINGIDAKCEQIVVNLYAS